MTNANSPTREVPVQLPSITALHPVARLTYSHGQDAFQDLLAQSDSHPADRHQTISPSRLQHILTELSQVPAIGWLSGQAYSTGKGSSSTSSTPTGSQAPPSTRHPTPA